MKTTTVTMTRAQVVKAIQVETNLVGGSWIEGAHGPEENCSVCAVGAVLWEAAIPALQIRDVARQLTIGGLSITGGVGGRNQKQRAVEANPFAALSAVFETSYRTVRWKDENKAWQPEVLKAATKAGRKAAIKFVKDFFPPRIKFSYNGEVVWIVK